MVFSHDMTHPKTCPGAHVGGVSQPNCPGMQVVVGPTTTLLSSPPRREATAIPATTTSARATVAAKTLIFTLLLLRKLSGARRYLDAGSRSSVTRLYAAWSFGVRGRPALRRASTRPLVRTSFVKDADPERRDHVRVRHTRVPQITRATVNTSRLDRVPPPSHLLPLTSYLLPRTSLTLDP